MPSRSTTVPAAPAAETATARRATILALLARLDAQAAAGHRAASGCAPPRSRNPLDDPATDPCRWQGFC